MKIIIVTGTPGTGKTVIAKAIAKKLKLKYIDVNKLIKQYRLYDTYNRKFKSYEVNIRKLNQFLVNLIKKSKENLVIDSHLSHHLPTKHVNLCVVTKTDLKILKKRLKSKRYNQLKIQENLACEIFDICHIEAKENKHKIIIIDTSSLKEKSLKTIKLN